MSLRTWRGGIERSIHILPNPCLTNASPYQTLGSSVFDSITEQTRKFKANVFAFRYYRLTIPELSRHYPSESFYWSFSWRCVTENLPSRDALEQTWA